MLELLAQILKAAEESFLNSALSISMLPGEYMDETVAPPDITKLEIEACPWWMDWVQVTAPEHDWCVYLERVPDSLKFREAYGATTVAGYCQPDCFCSYCKSLREAS